MSVAIDGAVVDVLGRSIADLSPPEQHPSRSLSDWPGGQATPPTWYTEFR